MMWRILQSDTTFSPIGVARSEAQHVKECEQSRRPRYTFSLISPLRRKSSTSMGKSARPHSTTSDLNPTWKLHDAFRDLRRQKLGQGLLRHQQKRPRYRSSRQRPRTCHRPERTGRPNPHTRHSTTALVAASPTSSGTASAKSRRRSRSRAPITATQGEYHCVYPIKVNQQRHVVEEVLDYGKHYGFGLEAGQQAGVAGGNRASPTASRHADHLQRLQGRRVHRDGGARAQDRPKNIIPVVEKFTELELLVKYMRRRSACGSSSACA